MIKNIITSRNTNYSIFIQCDCSREILNFYYYKETNTCPEAIGVDYFGQLKDKSDNKYKHFSFTHSTLDAFIKSLIESQCLNSYYSEHYDGASYLTIEKNSLGFYSIFRYSNKKNLIKKKSIWDIYIMEPQLIELIAELKNMQSTIVSNKLI